jgi:hypothetical protein
MSTPLTGNQIQASYGQVLQINAGLASSGGKVADGLGNASCMTLSAAGVTVVGEALLEMPNTTTPALVVKAVASFTSNLCEWQDSAGVAQIFVDPTLQLAFNCLGGPVYFGNFQAPTGISAGFSIPGNYVATFTTDQNVNLFVQNASPAFHGGQRCVIIGNALALPTANPTAGGYMYSMGGALYWHGSSGTVTMIAPA